MQVHRNKNHQNEFLNYVVELALTRKKLYSVGLGNRNPQQVTMVQNDEKSFLLNMVELALGNIQLNIYRKR